MTDLGLVQGQCFGLSCFEYNYWTQISLYPPVLHMSPKKEKAIIKNKKKEKRRGTAFLLDPLRHEFWDSSKV